MTKIWVLLFICLSVFSPITILGQTGTLRKYKRFEKESIFFNKIDQNGNIFCIEVKEDVSLLNKVTPSIDLHILPHQNSQNTSTGLKIILRATDQLLQYPEVISAFMRAAARWERIILTPITTVLDVDFGPTRFGSGFGENVLGATATTTYYALKSDNTNALVPDIVKRLIDLKPGNAQLQNLYNAIPVPTPSTVPSNLERAIGTLINLQALGFIEADISSNPDINHFGSVPSIGFNSSYPFDLDPSDGIAEGTHDFDATCVHEIGHALGFITAAGFSDHKGLSDLYYPWDLFRVRPEAVESGDLDGFSIAQRVTTAGPTFSTPWASEGGINYYFSNHVFFDGLEEVELSTADGEMLNGDGRQSSHWRDDDLRPPSLGTNRWIGVMDPTLPRGTRWRINHHDLRVLEVIGYSINYDYKYANMLLVYGSDTLDLDNRTDTLKYDNISLDIQKQIQFNLTNLSLDNPLTYEFEFILSDVQPSTGSVWFGTKSGSVAVDKTELITISLTTSNKPVSVLGILRIRTNDLNKSIVDIPFKLNTGGAIAPKINASVNSLGNFSFDTTKEFGLKTKSFTVSNLGNLPLEYEVFITLSTKNHQPTGLLKSTSEVSNTEQFYGIDASIANFSYSNDFENPTSFGGFRQISVGLNEWQKTRIGPAILKGHSQPNVVHFGKEINGELSYDNETNGFFYSPEFYINCSPEDIVSISFKYFNKSKTGDIVTFLGSRDRKTTWKELASSKKGGILKAQSTEWETVLFQFPDLANYQSYNQYWDHFAFQYSSDLSIVDQGFFLDDFQVTILSGVNPIYTSNSWGRLPTLNSSQNVDITVNGALFSSGFYNGNISIISNDFQNPTLTIPFTISYDKLNKAMKGIVYASTGSDNGGKVIKINPMTVDAEEIGVSGFNDLHSISLNPKTAELFGFSHSPDASTYVVKIDGQTGWGLYKFNSPVTLLAIAFTPSGDLLGVASIPPSGKFGVVTYQLFELDIATGEVKFLTTLKTKTAAMAIEPATGDVWISVDTTADMDKIYKINKETGDTTFVGRAEIGNHTIRALAFDNHGNLWGAYGEENEVGTIIKIDKSMGLATIVGTTNCKGITGLAFTPDSATEVNDEQLTPTSYALFNNYPNPFNPSTVISYQLPQNSFVILKVFDVLGKEVETLVNEYQTVGVKTVTLDFKGKELSSGIYFYQLKVGDFIQTKKMLLLK